MNKSKKMVLFFYFVRGGVEERLCVRDSVLRDSVCVERLCADRLGCVKGFCVD